MNKTRIWALLAALVLAMTAAFAVGCGDDDDEGNGNGGSGGGQVDLIKPGQLLVGIDTPYPPFEIGQPPDVTGYDIEVFNAVAKQLGLPVTYQDTAFPTIFRDLAQGKFDAVLAATTILPDREQTVDFSDPYYLTPQSLLVTTGSDIRNVDDLDGATVGAQDGTTGEFYAQDNTDASEVRGYKEGPDAINALKAGQVDAVIIDAAVAVDAVKKSGGIEIAQKIVTNELYGIPVAEDNDALLEQINDALAKIKEDGTLAKLYEKYFHKEPPKSVLEGTHEPE
jgi:polar amino acid transport system substrate-binding protein